MNDKTTISKFDQHNFKGHPPLVTLVICIFGFATTEMIGFDPKEARQGNLAIDVALLGFFIRITIWLKAFIITGVGSSLILITPSFLFVFRWPYH
jgi:amino acid permease